MSAQDMLVSNADRDAAVQRVKSAFAEGRFDASELETRLDAAITARTRGDLEGALRNLPVLGTSALSEPAVAEAATPTVSERICGAAAHLLGWPTVMIGPAVVAAAAKSPYVRQHAIEATNFQITFAGTMVALVMLAVVTLGIAAVAIPFLMLAWLALTVIGGLSALVGNRFHYPWAVRLLKP